MSSTDDHAKTAARRLRGRCLCGGVSFELEPPTNFVSHCHCQSCRLSHGAAFVTWTGVPSERFALTAGAELVRWFASSPFIQWGFCGVCGSSMLYRVVAEGHHELPKRDVMYVTAASLIDPLDKAPFVHVSWEEHVPWLGMRDELPKVRGKTSERIDDDGVDDDVVGALRGLASGDAAARMKALDALFAADDPRVVPGLERHLDAETDDEVRLRIVSWLTLRGAPET
jgi:hypothetical protein